MLGQLFRTVKRWQFVAGLAGLIVLGSCFLPGAPQAQAQGNPFCPPENYVGRPACVGYFTGQYATGNNDVVLSNGTFVNSATEYINLMSAYLNFFPARDQVGAAATINVMLGKLGPDFGGSQQNGINYARAHFNEWSQLVRAYDNRGDVIWNTGAISNGGGGGRLQHSSYDITLNDNYFLSSPFYNTAVIRFNVPGGGEPFQIERDCGNIFGYTSLSTPATGNLNPPTPGGPGAPPGFNNGNPDTHSSCQVISGHAFDPKAPGTGVTVTITYSIGGSQTTVASTSGSHLFTRDTPANVRSSLSPVTVTAVGTDSTGASFALSGSPITIGPCRAIAGNCVGMTVTPAVPDPGTPYSVEVSVRYGTPADAATVRSQPDYRFFLRITGPNGPAVVYNNPNVPSTLPPGSSTITAQVSLPPTGATGTYAVGWGVTGVYGAVNCGSSLPGPPPTFTVLNKPYVDVNGGDISAGAAMVPAGPAGGTNCAITPNDKASIVSWNRNPAAGNYGGAGTQHAAFALNHLQEFATAQGSATAPQEPTGLSFANAGVPAGTVAPSAGMYGGKFGGSNCVANYFANATPATTTNGPINLSALPGFPAAGNVPNGARLTYYIDGDLLIDSNVRFSGNYANTAAIPTFSIIVKGNIYISPGIQQLDGIYIAQPSTATATNGIIYTCAPAGFNTTAANVLKRTLQNACNTQLVVNGAFVARQVWLLRTAGTVSSTPAEIFNYVPELWLTAPFGNGLSASSSDYDAITSLPPVL